VTLNKAVQTSDRTRALAELSEDHRKKLATFARMASRGTPYDPEDLSQGAVLRWLQSEKPIEGAEETFKYLMGAIKSIRSNHVRREKTIARYEGKRAFETEDDEEALVEQGADPVEVTESSLFQDQLLDLFRDDDEVLELLMEQMVDATPGEIRKKLNWDKTKYETVQKRKTRKVAKLMIEGELR